MALAIPAVALSFVGAGASLIAVWPKDPQFEVVKINLSGFKLRFVTDSPFLVAVVDLQLTLSIKVTNKNIVGIQYGDTTMNIFYKDTLLGKAQVASGKQGPRSEKILEVPARMDGLEVSGHVRDLMSDVANRRMALRSIVLIPGEARLGFIRHPFQCRVESDLFVDPISFDIIDQDNRVKLELGLTPRMELDEPLQDEKQEDNPERAKKDLATNFNS